MRGIRTLVDLTALGLVLLPVALEGVARAETGAPRAPSGTDSSRSSAMPEDLRAAMTASVQRAAPESFHFHQDRRGLTQAANPRQRFGVRVEGQEVAIAREGAAPVSIRTSGVACRAAPGAERSASAGLPAGGVRVAGNRVEIERQGGMVEWYVNGPLGLEQGYTLGQRPCEPSGEGFRLDLEVGEGHSVAPVAGEAGALAFLDAAGHEALRYSEFVAYDAAGRRLGATMTGEGHRISLTIDDRGASYPITVDPLLWVQAEVLQGGMAFQGSQFGSAFAFDGDVAVVGAPLDVSGAAYVYSRAGSLGAWTQVARLTPEDGYDGYFGFSVALSGLTAIIGATNSIYVFTRQDPLATWKQSQKIAKFGLGGAVAVSGTTLFAGVPTQDLTGQKGGEVQVFEYKNFSSWEYSATLEPADLKPGAQFGSVLAVQDSVLVVGAPQNQSGIGHGSAYVYTKTDTGWNQAARLVSDATAGDSFGAAVATDGQRVLVGDPLILDAGGAAPEGAVFLYAADANGVWGQTAKIPSPVPPSDAGGPVLFGASVALTATRMLVGAPEAIEPSTMTQSGAVFDCLPPVGDSPAFCGATYPSSPSGQQLFGQVVGLNPSFPDTAIIGSLGSDADGATGTGRVFEYTWDQASGNLVEGGHASAYDGNLDVGESVAIDGDTAVVGAPRGTWGGGTGLKDAGSVYVFNRHGNVWTEATRLFAKDTQPGASFGNAVSLSGTVLAVGAFLKQNGPAESGANGALYIYDKLGDEWTESAMIPSPDGDNSGFFGSSVAATASLFGHIVAAGAPKANVNGAPGAGAAYVYSNEGSGWTQKAKLVSADVAAVAGFGTSVSLGIDTLAVGSPQAAVGGKLQAGKVYMFRQTGTSWGYWTTLQAADGAQFDGFGQAVSHTAGTVLVGAPVAANNTGVAYVFELNAGGSWAQSTKFAGSSPGDSFGSAVAVAPGVAVIGAPYTTFGQTTKGSIYVSQKDGGGWQPTTKIKAAPTSIHPFAGEFGHSVAISASNEAIAVGSPVGFGSNPSPVYIYSPGAANGASCAAATDCASSFCVDGVCCNSACGGGDTADCQACSVAAGGTLDGICNPLQGMVATQQTCRPAAGECDLPETCGQFLRTCTPDVFQPDGTACSTGTCSAGVCTSGAGGSSGAGGEGGSAPGGAGGDTAGGAGGDPAGGAGGDPAGGAGGDSAGGAAGSAAGTAGSGGSSGPGGAAGSGGSKAGSAGTGGVTAGGAAGAGAKAGSGGATAGGAAGGVAAGSGGSKAGAAGSAAAGKSSGPAGSAGAAGAAGAGGDAAAPADAGDAGGCSVSPGPRAPGSALGLLLASVAGLVARRRRQRA